MRMDGAAAAGVLHQNLHRVVKPRRILSGLVADDLGGLYHPLQIADAAVVAVLLLLGALILKILAEIAEGPRRLHVLDELGPQLLHPIVDLLLHLLNVLLRQFVVHTITP